jgi:hypothetical protein
MIFGVAFGILIEAVRALDRRRIMIGLDALLVDILRDVGDGIGAARIQLGPAQMPVEAERAAMSKSEKKSK